MAFGPYTTGEEAATVLADNIKGKNIVVTGVSPQSLGAEVVRVLAPHAKTIIVASRSVERAEESIKETKAKYPNTKIQVFPLDLTSLEAVKQTAQKINALNIPIHALINNAGVSQEPALKKTADGNEWQFGGNHLGHYTLTGLLWPSILASKPTESNPAAVVNVASAVHGVGYRAEDPNYTKSPEEYDGFAAYATSKSANILFSRELAKRAKKDHVKVVSLHPGAIGASNMGQAMPQSLWVNLGLLNEDGSVKNDEAWKSIERGTSTHIVGAFDNSIASGSYLNDAQNADGQLAPHATNDANAANLWALSEKLTGVSFA